MLRNVFLKTLRDSRRSITYYSIGMIATGLYVAMLYPTIRDASGLTEFMEQMPEVMRNLIGDIETLNTPEGFLNVEIFSFMAPLIAGIFAIIAGTGAIAGEEEKGTLDQLMANPASRRQVMIQKIGAMLTGLLVINLALGIGLVVGAVLSDFDLSISRLAQAMISLYALTAALGLIALGVGASTGRKGVAAGVAAAVGVIGFLLETFLSVVEFLEPTKFVSVFFYYNSNDVIIHGLNYVHLLALVMVGVVATVVGLWKFERRDLQN